MHDYTAHVSDPNTEQFQRLNELTMALHEVELEVAQHEASLKVAKEKARDIAERQLPELMDEMGLDQFVTKSGLKVKVKTSIHASIPKARLREALGWLDENGHGGLIKTSVTTLFNRGEKDEAAAFAKDLAADGFTPKLDEGVHSATLRAFVREMLERGEELDIDLFGIFRRRTVQVGT